MRNTARVFENTVEKENAVDSVAFPICNNELYFFFHLSALSDTLLSLLSVYAAPKGSWQNGFFDHGSFMEIMQPWAQSVVVGRAR